MELLPGTQQVFEKIRSVLEEVYRLYGFLPLDTPVLESSEILLAKAGGETEKQIYRFSKGDSDLTMRFDLTVPLAKYVALHAGELVFPFRRYQIGKVYRGERAQRGRFREFYQADIDIIGDGKLSVYHDAEIPSVMYEIFTRLGLKNFVIRLNNRKILSGFFSWLGIGDKTQDVLRIVDKIDKMGREKVIQEMSGIGVSDEICGKVIDFIGFRGSNEEVEALLNRYAGCNELYDQGVRELGDVLRAISSFGVPKEAFAVDLSIARGLDYYTGTVYETTLLKHPEIGSICSGGRYDNLAEYYTDRKLPGVGMSIGLTRLFFILNDREYLSGQFKAPADVMILPMTEDMAPAISLSSRLRAEKIRTQICLEEGKFKTKIHYADRLGVRYVLFLGEDEIRSGMYALKDMQTGEQKSLSFEDCVKTVRAMQNEVNNSPIVIME